jgi:hypothetical protein
LDNADTTFLESNDYTKFAVSNLRQALKTNEAIIGNNVVQDLSSAPITNTNFANLRMALILPVMGHGAIYLDRPIRSGVIQKVTVDRLMALIKTVLSENPAPDLTGLFERYKAQNIEAE